MCTFVFTALVVACQSAPLPTTLKLQRSTLTMATTGRPKNFYSAKITLGQPAQEFHVAFDLGGGTTVLPSNICHDAACLERRRYDKWASDTAVDIQANGERVQADSPKVRERMSGRDRGTLDFLSTDLGSGKVVGNFVRDQICMGADGKELNDEQSCFELALLVAYKMADVPFGVEPYDGAIGLGLKGMSVGPEFNFIDAFMRGHQRALPNQFALHLGGQDGGEITFGGFDVKKLTHPLEWVTVAEPEEGRWQVAISAIRVGNDTLRACRDGNCLAALDYGSSLLSIPSQFSESMEQALELLAVPSGYGDGCQLTVMPDLQIVLKNDVVLTLPAEDYVNQISSSGEKGILRGPSRSCRPKLAHHNFDGVNDVSVDKAMFVLGESVLRRYSTFFDADSLKVGFSLASGSTKKALPPMLEAGKGKEWMSAPDAEEDGNVKTGIVSNKDKTVILLVQVKLLRSKTL